MAQQRIFLLLGNLALAVGSFELLYQGDAVCSERYGLSLDYFNLDCGSGLWNGYCELEDGGAIDIQAQCTFYLFVIFLETPHTCQRNSHAYFSFTEVSAKYAFDEDIRITTKLCTADLSKCKLLVARKRIVLCNETAATYQLTYSTEEGECASPGTYYIAKTFELPESGLEQYMESTYYKDFKINIHIEHSQYNIHGGFYCNIPLITEGEESRGRYYWSGNSRTRYSALGGALVCLSLAAYGIKKRRLEESDDQQKENSVTEFVKY